MEPYPGPTSISHTQPHLRVFILLRTMTAVTMSYLLQLYGRPTMYSGHYEVMKITEITCTNNSPILLLLYLGANEYSVGIMPWRMTHFRKAIKT